MTSLIGKRLMEGNFVDVSLLQSSRSRTGILRLGGVPSGEPEQLRGGSPTVSWHRSVTGTADMQRRPPLSNIFPAAGQPSPEKPRSNLSSVSPQQPTEDASMGDIAAGSSEADKPEGPSPPGSMPAEDADSRAALGSSSTASWPRSVAHGQPPRPSLLTAFPTAGQGKPPPGQACDFSRLDKPHNHCLSPRAAALHLQRGLKWRYIGGKCGG